MLLLALSASGCVAGPPAAISSTVNYEGLADVRKPYFEVAQVRPETVFSAYDGVIVNAPKLAFRTPDRTQKQFPLDENQKRRFQEALTEAFTLELSSLQNLELNEQPGPSVLELTVRVENITATVPTGKGMQIVRFNVEKDWILVLDDASKEFGIPGGR